MKQLITAIKNSVENNDYQIHEVTSEDYKNLKKLKDQGYINYQGFSNAPDIVDIEKGENYDKL